MSNEIMFPLDIETLDVLIKAASHHYDSSCKLLAANGGLLMKWKEQIQADPSKMVTGTVREIDTTAKAAEMTAYLPDEKDRRLGAEYFLKSLEAIRKSQTVHDQFAQVFGDKVSTITIDPGDKVFCDDCGDDFTNSDRSGGLLFQSKAFCPDCAPTWEANAKKYSEKRFIKARCPEGVSFTNWVRGLR